MLTRISRRHPTGKVGIESKISGPQELIPCRSLEDIGQRSQTLLAKGKCARILDKAQDAQEVGRLVEQLRQAILIYQVGTETRRDWVD